MASNQPDFLQECFMRNLGVISEEEQMRLLHGRVTVVGSGGVGGITLIQLARMGVGQIHVIDRDVFEASNINRQMLSSISRLGQSKAECARETLEDIHPSIQVRITEDFLTEENAEELLSDTDVIVDATDDLVSRVIIHRTAQSKGIPSIWIAVTPPFRGGVMCLTPDSPPYEKILRHPSYQKPLTEEVKQQIRKLKDQRAVHSAEYGADPLWVKEYIQKEAAWAVIAPVANIVGLLASFEAFKFLIQRPELPPVIGPQLIRVNLGQTQMVQVETPEDGSWDNTQL
ncbi:HesA/MoeB/ThiF family protein [Hazenella coriacea]|uniref:ThiF family protein n=1 Tax=Hazenella coriacea TaxID=1179467 RepID=A0A4R3L8Q5_9BACL|nr:ThiF family adenylyltransferase [Hazenella coriacea]TCS93886.1 ThiF family protein [Hazenella coriacea]